MDGAHHHVCLVKGGQDPGDCPANREISADNRGQSDCDSETVLADLLECVDTGEQPLPLLI